jgi:hypothetical protein
MVPFSISSIFLIYTYEYIDIETGAFNRYIYIRKTELYIYAAVSKRKQKTEAQAIFLNPFTVCSFRKRNLHLSVC